MGQWRLIPETHIQSSALSWIPSHWRVESRYQVHLQCFEELALPDRCANFRPTILMVGHKFSGIVIGNSATRWTCTKLCPSAMGHRRTFLKKSLFLQCSSLASLLMPTFINIPVQTHYTWYIWMHSQCSPCLGTPETLKGSQEKKGERMLIRRHNVRVTDSHRAAPSFEVESLCFYLTSHFTDISTDRFTTLGRAEEVSRFLTSLMSVWVLLLAFMEPRVRSILVLD